MIDTRIRSHGWVPANVRTTPITGSDDGPARLVVSRTTDAGERAEILRPEPSLVLQAGQLTVPFAAATPELVGAR